MDEGARIVTYAACAHCNADQIIKNRLLTDEKALRRAIGKYTLWSKALTDGGDTWSVHSDANCVLIEMQHQTGHAFDA
jgi:hypothetical protein